MPKNLALNNHLARKALNHYGVVEELWIGLNDIKSESKFEWADGNEVTWTHFAKGYGPTSNWIIRHIQDCVAINPFDGFWHDFPCIDLLAAVFGTEPKKQFICQYQSVFVGHNVSVAHDNVDSD